MRTVTGLFDDFDDARAAVADLETAGISSDDISIVASNTGDRYSTDSSDAAEGAGAGAGCKFRCNPPPDSEMISPPNSEK
ncbi:hypothetical protein A8M32_04005 [Sinorhizobium alkalisoli]|uniref:Uncharacterized protein n=1 Tax=Sinorhizobium alkalisoli TaxID=1752398 RepID=A0A1E3VGI0_9HYPH|nr:hypothetical protein A8M32_04005 [Sinorhizobium alkalisoli]